MITLSNDYHNTSVRLKTNPGNELTIRQLRRARRVLCGISGCNCGGPAGERGPQAVAIEQIDVDRLLIVIK